MKFSPLVCALVLAAAGAAQAQGMSMPKKPVAAATASTMPLVEGQVKRVDPAKGLIVLRHGDIPNLGMTAMTMGFDIADKELLKGVKAGQAVRFQAEMVDGKATVTQLERVRLKPSAR